MAQEAEGYGGYQGYGGYGAPMDPQTMRAKLAMAMLQQGSDSSPIRSPWQGAARMSNALFGALMMRQMQDKQQANSQAIQDQFNAARAGGFGMGGAGAAPGGGSPGLPPQPGALSDLTNDPDIQRGVANAATNGLPDSATIGASMQRGAYPPQMGPTMPGMAPNNAAGGMPPGYIGGGGGPGSIAPNMTAQAGPPPRLDPRMMVAGPGAPSLPPSGPASGNGPQGAGAGAFNPQDLAMLQQDMQAVPGTSAGAGGGGNIPGGGLGTAAELRDHLVNKFGLTPAQATGFAGTLGYESGNFKTMQEQNPVGGGPGGYGWAQWTGPRRLAYMQYAQANGLDPSSPQANQGFLDQELSGPYAGALAQIKQTGNVADAAKATLASYEGMPDTPAIRAQGGIPATQQHVDRALQYAQELGGGQGGAGPAVAAIQGAAGPPGGGPAPNNMFAQDMRGVPGGPSAPQGQVPGSMQPNMMVAGPGVPSGARGGAPPPMPPPGALGPPPNAGGGGNPLSALGNMFGMGNPSGPQGGPSPAPAGGGAPGGGQGLPGVDPQVLMRVAMDPYSSPQAREMAGELLKYYMPHPMEWKEIKGTNDQQGFNPMTGQPVPGQIIHGGPQRFNEAPGATEYTLPSSGQGQATPIAGYGARPLGGGGAGGGAGGPASPGPSNSPLPGEPYEAFKARMEKQGGNEGALAVPSTDDFAKITTGARGDETYKDADVATGAYNFMARSSALSTHATDKGLIDAYARLMNPGRAVGKGQYQINADIQSMPDEIKGDIMKAYSGAGVLSTQTRAAMLADGRMRAEEYQRQWNTARQGWAATAKHGNIDESAVPNVTNLIDPDWTSINRYTVDSTGRIVDSQAAKNGQGGVVPHEQLQSMPGVPAPASTATPPVTTVKTPEDVKGLSKGTRFLIPDGSGRIGVAPGPAP